MTPPADRSFGRDVLSPALERGSPNSCAIKSACELSCSRVLLHLYRILGALSRLTESGQLARTRTYESD